MVIGFALVLSYKSDEKKSWVLFVLLYALYQIVSLLILQNNTYLWIETISCSLYPAIVFLGLMLVVIVAKWINRITMNNTSTLWKIQSHREKDRHA